MTSPEILNDDRIQILITHYVIHPITALDFVALDSCGCSNLFVGRVRSNDEHPVQGIYYTSYESMAIKEMYKLGIEYLEKFKLSRLSILHRLGYVKTGEPSFVVAMSSPHREESMNAMPLLLSAIKTTVPIWKKENLF